MYGQTARTGEILTSFKWVIDTWCLGSKKTGDALISPVFVMKSNNTEVKWQLELYPKGDREQNKDYISIYLQNLSEISVNADVTISLLNILNKVKNKMSSTFKFKPLERQGYPNFLPRISTVRASDFNVYQTDNQPNILKILDSEITILVEISLKEITSPLKPINQKCNAICKVKELDDFEKLLSDDTFKDITFNIDGKELRAHRNILAARSEVFKAMFSHNLKEKVEGKVEIVDINYEVFEQLLRFVYTGKIDNIEGIDDLFIAAERYSLEGLKAACELIIGEKLTTENVIRYLGLADLHNAAKLKIKAIEFIAANNNYLTE